MASVLHPCASCGHRSMDECWEAGQRLLRRNRKLCLDCHDECLPKAPARSTRKGATSKRSDPKVDPRLYFSPRFA